MPSMIDHIVIVDRDLDEMVRQAESLGFTVVPGGEHAGGMTHNALIAFADGSYIELIAFIDPEKRSTHRWWPRLWKGGGLGRLILYLILGSIGFWIGHVLGNVLGWTFGSIGPLRLGMAVVAGIGVLLFGHWLSLVQSENER